MGLSNGKLTAPFTKIAANGQGDLQRALGSSSLSQIALFAVSTNKWAKYQPFVSATVYADRYSDSSSTRLAGLKAANYGWGTGGIPSYANWSSLRSALGSITPGGVWTRTRPSVGNGLLRALDYDGYMVNAWQGLGVHNSVNLLFPFNGIITLPSTEVGPYDVMKHANMDVESPDGDSDTLLYLSDFAAMSAINPSYYNYTDWYFGVLCVPQGDSPSTGYLVNSIETIAYYQSQSDYPELGGIPFQVGNPAQPIDSGNYYLYPVINSLLVSSARNFVQIYSGWGNDEQGPGRMVLLDGWRLPVTIDANKVGLNTSYSVSVGASTTTISITFENNTGMNATIANGLNPDIQPFIYVTSAGIVDGQDATDFWAVLDAIQEWVDSSTKYTGGVYNGTRNVSRYINVYNAFYAANGNSNVLAAGTSATFSVTINSTTDPLGFPYTTDTQVDFQFGANINGTYKRYSL